MHYVWFPVILLIVRINIGPLLFLAIAGHCSETGRVDTPIFVLLISANVHPISEIAINPYADVPL